MLESRCSLNMQREFLRFEETGVQLTRALALNDNDLLYFHQIRDIPLTTKRCLLEDEAAEFADDLS